MIIGNSSFISNFYNGANEGTTTTASTPECALKKKHVALSYHFVREQTAVGTINPCKVDGKDDLLTKALNRGGGVLSWCTHQKYYPSQPILWRKYCNIIFKRSINYLL
jgi:hypothetical protein